MKTNNYTYQNGLGKPYLTNTGLRTFGSIQLQDGRWFFDRTVLVQPRDYVESKDCYEIVMSQSGRELCVNLCNGMCYDITKK